MNRRTTLLVALALAACTADLPTAPAEDGGALLATLPPPPPPPEVLSASLGGGDGRAVSTYVGTYDYSIYSRITFAGLLNYSGRPDGYLPGSGAVDAAGILVQNQCHLNLGLRMVHPPVGSYLYAFQTCFYPARQVGSYIVNAVVKGEVYLDRWPGPPLSCNRGGTPCVSYSGSQTVTIEPLEGELTLTANKTTVPPGGYANLYAKGVLASDPTEAVPLVVREWRFEGQGPKVGPYSTKICGVTTAAQCAGQFFQSGHVVVEALVNGVVKTERLWITAVGGDTVPTPPVDTIPVDTVPTDTIPTDTIPGGGCGQASPAGPALAECEPVVPPVVSMICTPGTVVRTGNVACEVFVVPATTFTVDSIKSVSGSHTVAGPSGAAVSAGGLYSWSGMALLPSQVTAWVTYDSLGTMVHRPVSGNFAVQARQWNELDSKWQSPSIFRHTLDPYGRVNAAPVRASANSYSMVLGLHVAANPRFDLANIGHVSTGPNAGLHYVIAEVTFDGAPRIYTTPAFASGATYNDQDGGPGTQLPRCTLAQWTGPFQREAERHEGVTQTVNSHWGIFQRELALRKLNQEYEALISAQGNPYMLLNDVALRYFDWTQTIVAPLQHALDVQDVITNIPLATGCEPDFDPTDR